jgi:hypothetical protein
MFNVVSSNDINVDVYRVYIKYEVFARAQLVSKTLEIHFVLTLVITRKDEAQSLLACSAVFLIECRQTFQRCVLPPSPGRWMMEAVCTSETSVDIQLRTRQYIPEDSELHTRHRENVKSHTRKDVVPSVESCQIDGVFHSMKLYLDRFYDAFTFQHQLLPF